MNIQKTIIAAAVALTMVAMVAPAVSSAATVSSACSGVTFTRNLKVGMSGQDVQCLQVILNMSPTTQVSVTGAGSPGNESMYFGQKTLAAVKIWQAAQGWTPAAQVGPLSRAKLNAWLLSGSMTSASGLPTGCTSTSGFSPVTGASCSTGVMTTLPQGCTSTSGFSPVTGVSCATGVTATVQGTGPVNVMLSTDTPAAGGSIVGGQATADLAHFTFTGNGTVTSVTLTRSGISDQNTLTNVYLYQGNTRLTDGYSFNLSGQLVMNGLNIVVNGSDEISVRADVEANASTYASSIAVALTGYTANSAAVTANVQGNMMYVVVGNLASVSIGTNTVAGASVNAGTTSYTFWSAPIQVNTRAVWLKSANFREIGSAPSNALANIHLFIDGVSTGATGNIITINGSSYIMFDLTSAPVSLATGSHTVDVRADIEGGADRSVQLSVQQAADFMVTDPQLGVNIAASGTPNNAGTINILTGSTTVVIDPTFTSQTNVSGGAANSVIGKFVIHSYGEDVKVSSILVDPALSSLASSAFTYTAGTGSIALTGGNTAGFVAGNAITSTGGGVGTVGTIDSSTAMHVTFTVAGSSNGTVAVKNMGLNNVTLYFNGSQVGSQQNWDGTDALTAFQLGSQVIAPAGQDSSFEVHADLQGSNSVAYGAGTVTVELDSGATANAQGQTSQNSTFVPGGASEGTITTSGLTIQTGLLAVSKSTAYLNQSISPNTTGVQIGSYTIQNQSTSESIRLTSFNVVTNADTSNPPTTLGSGINGISDLSALRTSDTTGAGSTPLQPTGNDNFSVNDTLAPGASMVLNIFANTSTSSTIYVQTKLKVSSIGVTDNISATSSQLSGQILSLTNGSVANPPTIISSSTTPSQYIPASGGSVNGTQATFNFISNGGSSTITELKFNVSGSDVPGSTYSQTVTNVCVVPTTGSAMCASPVNGVADVTGLNLMVPNGGGGLTQNVQVSYSGVGTTGVTPGTQSQISLGYVKFTSGGVTSNFSPSVSAPVVTLVGSLPTLTIMSSRDSGLNVSGTGKIGQVTVAANAAGNVKINTIVFTENSSGFSSAPSAIGSPFLSDNGNTALTNGSASCSASSLVVTCHLDADNGASATNYDGYTILAGHSVTFTLFGSLTGEATAGSGTPVISSSVGQSTFKWDDTSTGGASGTNLSGTLIYGFPNTSYSIGQ